MKFLTLTALLAVAKADGECTADDENCECDADDAENCLLVDTACTDGEHSACDGGVIVA